MTDETGQVRSALGSEPDALRRLSPARVTSRPACAGAISFPLPQPLGLIDAYTVYVGFDPVGAKPPDKKRAPVKRGAKPAAKPR